MAGWGIGTTTITGALRNFAWEPCVLIIQPIVELTCTVFFCACVQASQTPFAPLVRLAILLRTRMSDVQPVIRFLCTVWFCRHHNHHNHHWCTPPAGP
jgi:hypothetical protein